MLSQLSYLPLKEQWLFESPLFSSQNPRLIRAGFRMLAAAWRNEPSGSLPPSYAVLASVTGLDEQQVAEHYAELTAGWELRDERLCHLGMSELADRLNSRHAEAIAQIADSLLMAAQATQTGENFELSMETAAPSRLKGRRALPLSWKPLPETVAQMVAHGLSPDDQQVLITEMSTWARSKAERRADWDATLLNFMLRKPLASYPSRSAGVGAALLPVTAGRFGALVHRSASRGEEMRDHNARVFERVNGG